jgi:putative aldouronate transport system substrate-binding protein
MDFEEDDLLDTYGQGIIEALGWNNINTCRVDGTLYAVPSQHDFAQGRYGLSVRTDILQEAEAYMDLVPDYDADTWKVNGLEDIVTIIKAIHEAEPNMTAYRPSTGMGWIAVDNLGGNFYGVLDNWGVDTTEVVNMFTTQTYLDYVNVMYDLNQSGCISPDALTDTTANTAAVQAGTAASYLTHIKPGIAIQESTNCGMSMTTIQGGPDHTSSTQIGGSGWMIGYTTVDPVAAMQYLNFMYTSTEWNNLFMWGVEGVDSVISDDGTADFTADSDYTHAMQWISPAEFLGHPQTGNPSNLWEMYEDFNNGAIVSTGSGFTFSTANVATQYTAVDNVYSQYQKAIEYGFSDPESSIAEMNDAMMTAGLQDIIDEKQRQFDAWLATKN